MLRQIAVISSIVLLSACGGPGTEKWCAEKKALSMSEWTADDAKTYTQNCLIDSTTIGSDAWCEKLKGQDKGDMTVDEAAAYAKSCVI
jgi:hypothetical protein